MDERYYDTIPPGSRHVRPETSVDARPADAQSVAMDEQNRLLINLILYGLLPL
jgi:hypothetical protein